MADEVEIASEVRAFALGGLPIFGVGDNISGAIAAATTLVDDDVVVVTSKVISRVEGRFIDLGQVQPSEIARTLAKRTQKDPRLVELILHESSHVSREAPGVLITRHHSGIVGANAGIDQSNARPSGGAPGEWVLLLPTDPDASARCIRDALVALTGAKVAVIITDSLGRPFRHGTVGTAIGAAGLPALNDHRGKTDLFGRVLECTITALADQVAAMADLVAGQSSEARPVVVVRGLRFAHRDDGAVAAVRRADGDLYL